ncbi:thiol-disulfide oxidoreductase DCC family protein [Chitinophaga pendula]|uniref:thiol-disulfide oxidoreductase DCC family protein n=1 Tax=Chitinophaga TaxID=79328 RepID=UPI000BAEB10E|nr:MULTISPECIES: thiol-disulfide oxidoreductase DCC family protein [Chitinophaga]ASZ12826.1 thiol-disulfide oxidoreductase [Chitinophaga sp. MD30]UCJ09547.1 thiol-disulfide oxidoreductase DCC family protein [Chitinophaga pendula]
MDITHPVILFDGVCNLCNNSVNFVIRHDRADRFRFASLQSEAATLLAQQYQTSFESRSSFILIEEGKVYQRSTAALRVVRHLGFPYYCLYLFMILPAFLRDAVYNQIARNRYRWFGKKDACMIPTSALRSKFL